MLECECSCCCCYCRCRLAAASPAAAHKPVRSSMSLAASNLGFVKQQRYRSAEEWNLKGMHAAVLGMKQHLKVGSIEYTEYDTARIKTVADIQVLLLLHMRGCEWCCYRDHDRGGNYCTAVIAVVHKD